MNILSNILRGIAFVPGVVNGVEALFGQKSGSDKKEAALSFVSSALNIGEAVTSRDIVDEDQFRAGLGQVIDGVVACMNASVWTKTKA
jgi:hypothetical protein